MKPLPSTIIRSSSIIYAKIKYRNLCKTLLAILNVAEGSHLNPCLKGFKAGGTTTLEQSSGFAPSKGMPSVQSHLLINPARNSR